ncbi:MAG: SBBP repeat-containing protein [candidate division WOR-3 bacterium]
MKVNNLKFFVLFLLLVFLSLIPTLLFSQVDTAWVRRYNGLGKGEDYATSIFVDRNGNVYVTGRSEGSGTGSDYATLKYDANGNLLWERRYNDPGNNDDYATSLFVDNQGNVYVTGCCYDSLTDYDYITLKYDGAGKLLWARRYNGPGNGADFAYDLFVDNQGNVYVTGYSYGSDTGYDYATLKYDASGNLLWERRYKGRLDDYDKVTALFVDNQGNVYVTGGSYGSGTSYDYATLKYDASGNLLWARRYNGPGNGEDYAYALFVDNDGNVYVTGHSKGSGTNFDYATLKYDASGNLLWARRYNGPGNGEDETLSFFVDNQGNVYVTGGSRGSDTDYDYATIKYTSRRSEYQRKDRKETNKKGR